MMIPALAFALFAATAPEPPRVEEMANGQFRISVTKRGLGSDVFVRGILESRAEAARRCQGRGQPVEIGSGQITLMPNERWEMVSTYTCEAPPPPPAPPPGT